MTFFSSFLAKVKTQSSTVSAFLASYRRQTRKSFTSLSLFTRSIQCGGKWKSTCKSFMLWGLTM